MPVDRADFWKPDRFLAMLWVWVWVWVCVSRDEILPKMGLAGRILSKKLMRSAGPLEIFKLAQPGNELQF
jgi:hypothetical protein